MSLPAQVRDNPHIRVYRVMPLNETDSRHVTETWERKPHPSDVPASGPASVPASGLIPPLYYGEWINVTQRAKAEWNVILATNEMERLRREEARQRLIAQSQQEGRSALDPPLHSHITRR